MSDSPPLSSRDKFLWAFLGAFIYFATPPLAYVMGNAIGPDPVPSIPLGNIVAYLICAFVFSVLTAITCIMLEQTRARCWMFGALLPGTIAPLALASFRAMTAAG